jgi:hypothetical protein
MNLIDGRLFIVLHKWSRCEMSSEAIISKQQQRRPANALVVGLVLPSIFSAVAQEDVTHKIMKISRGTSVILLVAYMA